MTNPLSHCGDFRTSGRLEEGVVTRILAGSKRADLPLGHKAPIERPNVPSNGGPNNEGPTSACRVAMIAPNSAEISVRRYKDAPECDVIVVFRGQELSLRCRDYDQAVRWARIECKTYKVTKGFTVQQPAGALLTKLASVARRARSSRMASWPVERI